ncbi:GerMN domain-containing protein [Natroniella sulfidigena]|uniref:GerMN domain-containing protein n=1 Tax=Natroniella sulfidigena TaxID=723921 RepID=UPI002009E8F9|nr:GerMN domain-containing protein [Natroniella sulfidigena]MCK8816951.1 GerMN domain-containing protein [Natroniella sulfidigena]
MKRVIILGLMIVIVVLAMYTILQDDGEFIEDGEIANEIEREKEYELSDYYPFLEDTLLVYQGEGNEFAAQDVYFDFVVDELAQVRVSNPGATMGRIIMIEGGELRSADVAKESHYLEDLTDQEITEYDVLLKEPLETGTSWTLADGKERYISGIDVEIETPSGEYQAIEVTTELENAIQFDYYVAGVGHVKRNYQTDDFSVKTILEEIKEDTSITYPIKFFYPDFINEKIKYVTREVEFSTNDDLTEIFAEHLRQAPDENLTQLISDDTEINQIELDREEEIVKVDFSQELVTEMNVGHLLETKIIQSIVNIFGGHYNVDKVYLSLEGRPYESGHMMLSEDEYFTVDYEAIEEYQK